MLPPYIGITDFTKYSEVEQMLSVFSARKRQDSQYVLHVGVMMSHKTLHGLDTKWANVFPKNREVADIFASPQAYNCLHFADYDHRENIYDDLAAAISYGGEGIRAMQLDMVWPDPHDILRAKNTARSDFEIILQISSNAIEEAGGSARGVIKKLRAYDGVVDRILLDKSMGRGLGMDASALAVFVEAIASEFPSLGLGAAGGLGPGATYLAAPLVHRFKNMSFDAQGKLRESGSALDPINWNFAGAYLIEMLSLCESVR